MKKIVRAVFEIFTSGLLSGLPYLTSGFSTFVKTWKYYLYIHVVLCLKFGISNFFSFQDIRRQIFTTDPHTHIQAQIRTLKVCTDPRPVQSQANGRWFFQRAGPANDTRFFQTGRQIRDDFFNRQRRAGKREMSFLTAGPG